MRPLMCRSVPPKPAVMLSLAAVAVELPPFVVFLLVRWSGNFNGGWLDWPILDGLFPYFVVTYILKLVPLKGSIYLLHVGGGVWTLGLIALVFVFSWRSSYWPRLLTAGLAVSSVFTFLAFMLLRA
jgi:hypothetical protein